MIVGEAVLGQLSASCDDQPYTDHVLSYPSRSLDGSDESKEANFLQAGRSSFRVRDRLNGSSVLLLIRVTLFWGKELSNKIRFSHPKSRCVHVCEREYMWIFFDSSLV